MRTLLKSGRTQSSVGSGFMVGTTNLVLTNYHVVSQMALDPDVYTGEYVDTNGKSGPVELLAVDALGADSCLVIHNTEEFGERLHRAVQRFHMDTKGWSDIAYNFLVDRFGRLWVGRAGGAAAARRATAFLGLRGGDDAARERRVRIR